MSSAKAAKAYEGRIRHIMDSLTRYYTGKENSLENARELFKGLIQVPGLIVPADDILIFKSLAVPAIIIQGKGKVSLIELHECERGLVNKVVCNAEQIHMFLKQYKTKGETKMKELEGFELPQIEEIESNTEYKPLLSILQDVESGDILERESDGQGIILEGAVFSWYSIKEGKRTGTIPLTTALVHSKFRILPKYVGWQEAFEAYENGYTIGCEYGKETVWFNRDIVNLEESNILADKQLDGLITTKWILK